MRETFPHSLPSLVHLPTSFVPSFVHLPTSFVHSLLSFPHSPSSFPRRRESPRPCEATAFRFLSQSPRGARTGGKLAVDGNRHNATGCSRAQRKLVRARARGIFLHIIPKSTISNASLDVDGNRNNPTGCSRAQRKLVRARTRERRFFNVIPTLLPSFPRRRESPRPCEATAFRFLSQSPRGARTGGKLAVDGNRHNATGCSRAQRKLVRARARGVFPHVIPAPCLRHSHTHVIPTPTHVIPAEAGIPAPAAYWGPIAPICRPRVRHRPTNRTHEETRLRFGTARDTLIDGVRCRAPRRLANECRTAHPRTMLLKRPCA